MEKRARLAYATTLVVLTAFHPLIAQQGSTAAQFLKIGVDARAAAMGEASAAVASDVAALFWNPARLATISTSNILISHTTWIADLSHNFIGAAIPFGDDALGFSLTSVSMGETEVTTLEQPQGTGSFYSASDLALSISFARRMTDRLAVGISVKYVYEAIANETATGVAFDVGTSLDAGLSGLQLGMAFTNYGTGMQMQGDDLVIPYYPGPASTPIKANLVTREFPMPTNFRIGLSVELMGSKSLFMSSELSQLIVAVDGNHPVDALERGSLGVEYSWNRAIVLRAGYKYRYAEQGLSYGGGVKLEVENTSVAVDYALTHFGVLDNVHRFSIQIGF